MNSPQILDAFNLHKFYSTSGSKLHILKGIGIKIEEGEVISIVGPSGAGKSTLLHILGGLDCPSQGTVILDGEDIYGLDDVERANIRNQKIGFVFQFYHLLPEFTALENVMLPALMKGELRAVKEVEKKGSVFLERVGLRERAQHKPSQLSGGEQQRVAIARALMNEPKIIFCDEPTGNLDSATGKEIIDLLMDLNKQHDQTLVLVTHDENIARLSHRVIYMKDGEILKK